MNVSTKYNVKDIVYYLDSSRRINKSVVSEIYIKQSEKYLTISYFLTNGTPSHDENNLYSSALEVYSRLNSILINEVEKIQ